MALNWLRLTLVTTFHTFINSLQKFRNKKVSLNPVHYFTYILYILCLITNAHKCLKEKKMEDHFVKLCRKRAIWLPVLSEATGLSFWSPQLWTLLSHLQNETQRLHQKPSCLSDAGYCNTGQLKMDVTYSAIIIVKVIGFFSPHISYHSLIIHQKSVELLHTWQPLG